MTNNSASSPAARPARTQKKRLHFVGVGGIGMSGIAEVFHNQGFQVSGSDVADSDSVRRLAQLGLKIHVGHRAENVHGTDVVVVSSAIRSTNPELVEARKLRIPIIPRAEMLGELMRGKTGFAVAGTHGKTTTTSMLATVLTVAGLDPTIVIGGKVDSFGGNAKLGQGQYVVAEADESDGSFLHLPATYGVITNIDNDHLDYFGGIDAIDDAFVNFVGKIPFYGCVAVCGDDPGVRRALNRFTKPFVTYGTAADLDFYAGPSRVSGMGSEFEVFQRVSSGVHTKLGTVKLRVPGAHNVLNAMAVVAIATQIAIPFQTIAQGLNEFAGVKRRFEIKWRDPLKNQLIIDDYGHHPTEVSATLEAARKVWAGRIVTVFQPHRYSRTLHCKDGFLTAFEKSDVVLLTDIYAAGEDPIRGVSSEELVEAIRKAGALKGKISHIGDVSNAKRGVLDQMQAGDLVLCLGAGSITKLADELASEMKIRATAE